MEGGENKKREPASLPPQETPAKDSSLLRKLSSAVLRGVLLYLIFRWIQQIFLAKPPTSPKRPDGTFAIDFVPNAWSFGQQADLYVYVSEEPIQQKFIPEQLKLYKPDVIFGSFDDNQNVELATNISLIDRSPAQMKEPIFAHIYLVKKGLHPDHTKSKYDPLGIVYHRINLLGVMNRPREKSNLLSGSDLSQTVKPSEEGDDLVPYWYPEVDIALVQEQNPLQLSALPIHMRKHFSTTFDSKHYFPVLYLYDFWKLKEKRIRIDQSTKQAPLKITFRPMSWFKFQLLSNFDQSLQMNSAIFGDSDEMEKIKEMCIETNPYLLLLTMTVSLLHSIFDFLAFKNDIQFWKERNDLEGLSVRTVLMNAAFQTIIFLYLLDQQTSWVVLGSVAIGTLIEIWKITKVFTIRVYMHGMLPRIQIQDKASYSRSATREYDQKAIKFLGIVAIPLLLGYSIYSLLYETHKGWYSWILGTLVGFVYTFGFIAMTPQLFINYKLKSVAHMPWRVFVYKALNTFIDDLFAFVIRMPTLHRLACLRDDVVFLVYLYQRWIYPIDKSRPNEFGQVFDKDPTDEQPSAKLDDHQPALSKEETTSTTEARRRSARPRRTDSNTKSN